jgi:RimJ/RimL family protein N-acetyltransferase
MKRLEISSEIEIPETGVILKQTDEADILAMMMAGIMYTHKLDPSMPGAPGHQKYIRNVRAIANEDPSITRLAIWDRSRFVNDAFIGFGFIVAQPKSKDKAPAVDIDIMRQYQGNEFRYGTLAVEALTKYVHEDMGQPRVIAEMYRSNTYGRETVEKAGFVAVKAVVIRNSPIIYEHVQEIDASSQVKQEESVLVTI